MYNVFYIKKNGFDFRFASIISIKIDYFVRPYSNVRLFTVKESPGPILQHISLYVSLYTALSYAIHIIYIVRKSKLHNAHKKVQNTNSTDVTHEFHSKSLLQMFYFINNMQQKIIYKHFYQIKLYLSVAL